MKADRIRVQEAERRNEAWRALTPEEQLASLDARLGAGVGARKQRERIAKTIKKG